MKNKTVVSENPNKKIAVLKKMIGLGEEVVEEKLYMVPQNSSVNVKEKACTCEIKPLANSTKNPPLMQNCKCQHCENMAKNFLYLESLIRSNLNSNKTCSICNSSLQYLQFVNKSIMKVFGNFDSVVEAAKAFGLNAKPKTKSDTARNSNVKKPKSTSQPTKPKPIAQIKKSPNAAKALKTGKKVSDKYCPVKSMSKKVMTSSKKISAKPKMKRHASDHSAFSSKSSQKQLKTSKVKKIQGLNVKTKSLLIKSKSKN